uniref:Exostosin GT47 domain-containing protein n=1 Tax=Nucleocytoviricota sp. TaxID=2809609 RepID=A0A9E8G4C8_9VIRU|nr:hypothetical protein [Nucleocytoviricota sp.]UZT29055.1 hypothetical protein [Nucleocytoviricota sp.]
MANLLRFLPLKNQLFNNKGSIGYELPYNEWLKDITNSKFCFVIRGDTPTSHAFCNALSAGSIPVIISNHYDYVGLHFINKDLLNNAVIRFDENYFLQNPEKVINFLENISKEKVIDLINNLNKLQQIFLYNHPNNIIDKMFLNKINFLLI